MNKQEHVISLLVDDIMIYLKKTKTNKQGIHLSSFHKFRFGCYSGNKVNMLKTQILMFNCSPNQEFREWQINWEAKLINIGQH